VRKFSPLAEWKIRDFNEVSHLFHRRKRMSYPYANRYLEQFPKNKFNQMARFVAYVVGALAAVLGVVTMWDPELFLGFEIYGRTTLFWLGVSGTVFVALRNATSDEDDDLWDPEVAMNAVVAHTHYYPDSWRDRLYSEDVRQQFSAMYKLEALLFLDELVGIIVTPLVLMFSLPNCAEQLVDFFREFTVDVDGLGTVCSYALFDFKNGGKAPRRPAGAAGAGAPADLVRDGYYGDKANKMMESYYSFIDHYGPNPKRGLRGRSKRYFHPAPTFPGILGSPSGVLDAHAPVPVTVPRAHPAAALRQSTTMPQHQPHGTPRAGPAVAALQHAPSSSPMHSILLDPHHQPRGVAAAAGPASAAMRGPQAARGGSGSSLAPHDVPAEADEDRPAADGGQQQQQPPPGLLPRTTSNLLEADSDLGDSWMLRGGEPEAGDAGEGEAAREDGAAMTARNRVGVLGMIMELQKAQKEVRGGHV
jgi:autophagy-related protein 9